MPTQLEKLQAYAGHLLDDAILLREKYAMLKPMLFDPVVNATWGAKKRARGFQALQKALFLSCAQDVAKIVADKDDRVPSLHNILQPLEADDLRQQLREAFAVWNMHIANDDPVIAEILKRMELKEEAERRGQFDRLYMELHGSWQALRDSPMLDAFKTIRDKVSAHTEIRYHVDEYKRVELGSLGLKWGDLGEAIARVQEMVEQAGLIVRGASFAWSMLDEQLSSAAEAFWSPESAHT